MIRIRVQGYFEATDVEVDLSTTVARLKELVCLDQMVPIPDQIYFFRGENVTDSQTVRDIGAGDKSKIMMNIRTKFLEQVPPHALRDPFTGLLPKDPIQCIATEGDDHSYDKYELQKWRGCCKGRVLSPMTGNHIRIGSLNEPLQEKVFAYLPRRINSESAEKASVSLECMGRINNILGHFRHIVGCIPRRRRLRIVCMSNVGTERSAIMEQLTLLPVFPRGDGGRTGALVEVRCHRGPKSNPIVRVIEGRCMGIESEEEEEAREVKDCKEIHFVPIERGAEKIYKIMNTLGKGVCVDRYIVLDITGPTLHDVTYVDIPSWDTNNKKLVEDMLRHEFERFGDYSIYLHMTKSPQLVEDGAYSILRAFEGGRLLQRTVRVVIDTDMKLNDESFGYLTRLINSVNEYGAPLADGAVGGHLPYVVFNIEDTSDPMTGFAPPHCRASREKAFLDTFTWPRYNLSAWSNNVGTGSLVRRLAKMNYALAEEHFLPQAIRNMQERMTALHRSSTELGLPQATSAPAGEEHEAFLNNIISCIINTFQKKRSAILRRFDMDHLRKLEGDLCGVLEARDVPRLQVERTIRDVCVNILECISASREPHMEFWRKVFEDTLSTDKSAIKVGRFPHLIARMWEGIRNELISCYDSMERSLRSQFQVNIEINCIIDTLSCVIRPNRSQPLSEPRVKLFFNISPGMLAHVICKSMQVFGRVISNQERIRELLVHAVPEELVENCRLERFDIWNEQRLLHVATAELLDLAHEMGSTGCVLSPGRLVSLYHPRYSVLVGITDGVYLYDACPSCVRVTCNGDEQCGCPEGQRGVRLQVIRAGRGQVAFYCPNTRQCLSVTEGVLTVHDMSSHADMTITALPPQLLFTVQFQAPPTCLASYASSAVSFYHAQSRSYLAMSTEGESGNIPVLVVLDDMPIPSDDALFLVMANPEE